MLSTKPEITKYNYCFGQKSPFFSWCWVATAGFLRKPVILSLHWYRNTFCPVTFWPFVFALTNSKSSQGEHKAFQTLLAAWTWVWGYFSHPLPYRSFHLPYLLFCFLPPLASDLGSQCKSTFCSMLLMNSMARHEDLLKRSKSVPGISQKEGCKPEGQIQDLVLLVPVCMNLMRFSVLMSIQSHWN